jgi:nucleotide-binding universal stress UspA family protein
MKILVAVDGSQCSLKAVSNLIEHVNWYNGPLTVELVYVNPPLPYEGRVGAVVGKRQIARYYQEEGEVALAGAIKMLDAAGIRYTANILRGSIAEVIARHAKARKCDIIFIGTHGRTAAGNMLLGSVANKVLHIADVPVLLVR